jgi:hypothetical protein
MKKLVTTGLKGWLCPVLTVLATISSLVTSQAQGCIMTCPPNNPPVQVSLDSDCVDTLTYLQLGVTLTGCSGPIDVNIIENGIPIGDIIDTSMVGITYMVIVSNPLSGQSCMTMVTIVDKQAPILTCPADITLECTADLDAYNGLAPTDISDCSATEVFIDDVLVFSGSCMDNIISQYFRVYIVRDEFLNADTCEQFISLEKADLSDVEFPPDLTGINALTCFPAPDTSTEATGLPSVNGSPIVNGSFCNLVADYTDNIVPSCSGFYTVLRQWTVYDWCDLSVTLDSTQIIEIIDNTLPVVTAPADMTVSSGSSSCTADVLLPSAIVVDDCAAIVAVRTQGPFGTIFTNGGFVSGLPVGIHAIIYIATSECGLSGSDTMFLTVEDLQPPIPVCHQQLAVPLNNIGTALIPASAFNAASQDNCASVYFKVKRMSLPVGYSCPNPGNPANQFDDFIQFCCGDIENNEIMVILRVYDLPPGAGPVSDAHLSGHYNDCMVMVEVQDKLPPSITCPSDLTISCEFPFTFQNLDVFGTIALSPGEQEQICIDDPGFPGNPGIQCIGTDGLAVDNCSVTITETFTSDVNMCGTGFITRTFTATDDGGLQTTCQQQISIINYDLFDLGDITWPLDYTTSDVCDISLLDPDDLLPPFNAPVLQEGPCDLTGATYEDIVFDFTNADQACFKILRTWTVMDWCQLNTQTGGIWTHIQVIKVMNTTGPVIEAPEDLTLCSFDPECGGLTVDFAIDAEDDCSGEASLTWRYHVDIDNNATFDFTSPLITGSGIEFSRFMPIGSHRILYQVWDQCGNLTTEEQLVEIESCKAPSAKCIHGLSTNLMAMDLDGDGTADWGMVTIHAEMFDAGSDHPCGNEVTVAFSADPLDVTRVFDCDDIGANEIELWAIDENGLTDFCITTIDIQDNNTICPPEIGGNGIISGNISVPGSGKLAGAMVYLDGSNFPGTPSGSNGYFVFPSMPLGGTYEVRPNRNDDTRNGVTTLDLVKIQKHLLGLQSFSTPFEFIAADVNNSKTVTAIDIVQLRQLILGYFDVFPNNTSWRFVDNAHIFPDPANPWISEWAETYRIHDFSNTMSDVNFDAVKIGDLNLSANHQAGSGIILPRTDEKCEVAYNVTLQPEGDVYKIDIKLKDASAYTAVQFSFGWNDQQYRLLDWNPGKLFNIDDIRMPEKAGDAASVAVYSIDGWEQSEVDIVTLWVKALNADPMPFQLYLKPLPTQPVGYRLKDESGYAVQFTSESAPVPFYNRPNPFKDVTTIYSNSEVNEPGTLKVYDANGRLVLARSIQLVKGENEFYINRSEVPFAGIYVYEIQALSQNRTNRMIIVD